MSHGTGLASCWGPAQHRAAVRSACLPAASLACPLGHGRPGGQRHAQQCRRGEEASADNGPASGDCDHEIAFRFVSRFFVAGVLVSRGFAGVRVPRVRAGPPRAAGAEMPCRARAGARIVASPASASGCSSRIRAESEQQLEVLSGLGQVLPDRGRIGTQFAGDLGRAEPLMHHAITWCCLGGTTAPALRKPATTHVTSERNKPHALRGQSPCDLVRWR
jgi:hypothetical protein